MPKKQRGVKRREGDRRTISLPAELNRRMSEFDGVNWSAVAVRAFEAELGRLAQEKKELAMQDVIDRLRASKHNLQGDLYRSGMEAGRSWAKGNAEVVELKRIDAKRSELTEAEWEFLWRDSDSESASSGDFFAAVVAGEATPYENVSREFWNRAIGSENASHRQQGDFVRGFADGALEVWDAVKDKIWAK